MGWADLLQDYVQEHQSSSSKSITTVDEEAEMDALTRDYIAEKEKEDERKRHEIGRAKSRTSTSASDGLRIPSFYKRKKKTEDLSEDDLVKKERLAYEASLQFKKHVIDGRAIENLKNALKMVKDREHGGMNMEGEFGSGDISTDDLDYLINTDGETDLTYDEYVKLREVVEPMSPPLNGVLTDEVFAQLHKDGFLVSADSILQYIDKLNGVRQSTVDLLPYDVTGDGYLTEQQLERFLLDKATESRNFTQAFLADYEQFYPVVAHKKIFFFLDPNKRMKVKLTELAASPVMMELKKALPVPRTRIEEAEQDSNWFYQGNTLRLYDEYSALDRDGDGLLSPEELLFFRQGSLNPEFIRGVFERSETFFGSLIDFRTFVDFVLAMENKSSVPALRYFFRILDINSRGYLTTFEYENYTTASSHHFLSSFCAHFCISH